MQQMQNLMLKYIKLFIFQMFYCLESFILNYAKKIDFYEFMQNFQVYLCK